MPFSKLLNNKNDYFLSKISKNCQFCTRTYELPGLATDIENKIFISLIPRIICVIIHVYFYINKYEYILFMINIKKQLHTNNAIRMYR